MTQSDKPEAEDQAAEKTVWLCELQQAGAFGIRNVPTGDMPAPRSNVR